MTFGVLPSIGQVYLADSGPPYGPQIALDFALDGARFQDIDRTVPAVDGEPERGIAALFGTAYNAAATQNSTGPTATANGFAVSAGLEAGVEIDPGGTYTGHTLFLSADMASASSGFGLDSRSGGFPVYLYRSAPYVCSNVGDGNHFLGTSSYYTDQEGLRVFAIRIGTGVPLSIWRDGVLIATAAGSPIAVPVARTFSVGMYSQPPKNEPCVTDFGGILAYDGPLDDERMVKVSAYCMKRWGIV